MVALGGGAVSYERGTPVTAPRLHKPEALARRTAPPREDSDSWKPARLSTNLQPTGTGSYLRLIDFVYHSTLGLRVTRKKKRRTAPPREDGER